MRRQYTVTLVSLFAIAAGLAGSMTATLAQSKLVPGYLKSDPAAPWISDGQTVIDRQDEVRKAGRGGRGR